MKSQYFEWCLSSTRKQCNSIVSWKWSTSKNLTFVHILENLTLIHCHNRFTVHSSVHKATAAKTKKLCAIFPFSFLQHLILSLLCKHTCFSWSSDLLMCLWLNGFASKMKHYIVVFMVITITTTRVCLCLWAGEAIHMNYRRYFFSLLCRRCIWTDMKTTTTIRRRKWIKWNVNVNTTKPKIDCSIIIIDFIYIELQRRMQTR